MGQLTIYSSQSTAAISLMIIDRALVREVRRAAGQVEVPFQNGDRTEFNVSFMLGKMFRTDQSPYTRANSINVIGKFKGTLGRQNASDDYRLNVTRLGVFSAALTGLQDNASLQLRTQNGRVIARSNRPKRRAELIRRSLNPGTYFVRVLRNGGRTKYRLTISEESSSTTPVTPTNPFQALWGTYRGTAVTTIGKIDPLSRQFTSVNTFQTSAVGEVTAPKSAGGVTESNPFSLSLGASPAEIAANVEGAVSIFSAIPFDFRGGFLLQYWSIQYSSNQINATLINRDSGTALTTNLFNSTMSLGFGLTTPFPYAMDVGTTLTGTLTPSEIRVRIQGLDSGQTRAFVSDIVAQRV